MTVLRYRAAMAGKEAGPDKAELGTELVGALVKTIRGEGNWTLPALYACCALLTEASVEADARDPAQRNEHMQSAGRSLNGAFSALLDRKPAAQSKKTGAMKIVNIMFDIYFRLNNYRLCAPLTKILEGPGYPELEEYPVSHVVTYRYYTGRLHLFDGHYAEAESDLAYCFEMCGRQFQRNKRVALMYLIPAKLMNGKLPTPQLLQRFRLPEYAGLAEALRTGNLKLFNETAERHEALFRRRGLYLMLESLRWLVYRTLFRRTYHLVHQPGKPSVCNLAALQTALQVAGSPMELEEVECVIANLIYNSLVRGYMATQRDSTFLILSQKEPFPKIAQAILKRK